MCNESTAPKRPQGPNGDSVAAAEVPGHALAVERYPLLQDALARLQLEVPRALPKALLVLEPPPRQAVVQQSAVEEQPPGPATAQALPYLWCE